MIKKKNNITASTSLSINQKRWLKFKSMKRGYYSLIIILVLYALSWILPILVNSKALIVNYNDKMYFPAFHDFSLVKDRIYLGEEFGQDKVGEVDYVKLKNEWKNFNHFAL